MYFSGYGRIIAITLNIGAQILLQRFDNRKLLVFYISVVEDEEMIIRCMYSKQ